MPVNNLPHFLIGTSAGLAWAHYSGSPDLILLAAAAAVGASLPDIDQRWVDRRAPAPKPGSPPGLLEHRGPTHTLLASFALYWLCAQVQLGPVAIGIAIGYVSHLIADGPSYMGVPYFWPIVPWRIRLLPYGLRIASGSLLEWPISAAVFVWSLHYALGVGLPNVLPS
jgi:inner membrane protein